MCGGGGTHLGRPCLLLQLSVGWWVGARCARPGGCGVAVPRCRCQWHVARPARPQLEAAQPWEESVDKVLLEFEQQHGRRPLYMICWY